MIPLRKAVKTSQSEMRDIAARICRDYLNGPWKTIAPEEIQLRRISGGLSNFLYHVSLPGDYVEPTTILTVRGSPIVAHKRPRKDSESMNKCRAKMGDEELQEPREVLLRIYGQSHGEHALETMMTESVVFALLSERRLGPRLHGIFPGGRIEQYIPARPLKTGELAEHRISMKIAEKMAEIHSLDIPVSKEPDWIWKTTDRWLASVENCFNNNTENSSSDVAPAPESRKPDTEQRLKIKNRLRNFDFKAEVKWLHEQLKDETDFLVVFSHNDLQEGNILMREQRRNARLSHTNKPVFVQSSETCVADFEESSNRLVVSAQKSVNGGSRKRNTSASSTSGEEDLNNNNNHQKKSSGQTKETKEQPKEKKDKEDEDDDDVVEDAEEDVELMIIDFEYCSYNYRGFDLANHFLEWTFDYTNKDYPYFFHHKDHFPTEAQKKAFLDTYLKTKHMLEGGDEDVAEIVEQTERDLLEREIQFFRCASHIFWSLWAIVYSSQEIEFGYWEYAELRLNEYLEAKKVYLLRNKKAGVESLKSGGEVVATTIPTQTPINGRAATVMTA